MTAEEVMDIVQSSRANDWLYHDPTRSYTYSNDVNLRIVVRDVEAHRRTFEAEWTHCFDKPQAEKRFFDIFHGASPIKEVVLVDVDEGRGTLPIPRRQDLAVQREDYLVARCLDHEQSLDNYMQRAGMTVAT